GFFSRHSRRRHRDLLHREQRLSRIPVKYEREAHFCQLHNGIPCGVRCLYGDEDRRGGIIIIPYVVVHGLVVPLAFTRGCVKGDDAVAEQVRSLPESAVKVVGGRSCCEKDPASLFVEGKPTPGVGAAIGLSIDELPGVVAKLSRLGYGVKDPLEFTCHRVKSANVSGG